MDWTKIVWRILCLLAITSALTPFTPLWGIMPLGWQIVAIAPAPIMGYVLAVATYAEYSKHCEGRCVADE